MTSARRTHTPPRLPRYDYRSAGAYFVTICTYRRSKLLREAALAHMVADTWRQLPARFVNLELDAFVIMPDHLHGILRLIEAPPGTLPASLNDIVGAYKSLTAMRYLLYNQTNEIKRPAKLWQRGYYERVVRTHEQLSAYRRYLIDNPRRRCLEQQGEAS